jgi:long-chain acyl-CoA synthetase
VASVNRLDDNVPATVGRPLEGVEAMTTPEGELCVRGPALMLGYWNNRAATEAIIDAQGWLHTGDLVRMEDGRIRITGRAKEIIVMSNGEKVPPGDVEQAILMDTAFEQVIVIGEGHAHLGLVAVTKLTDPAEICRRANEQLHAFPGYVRIHHLVCTQEAWTLENGMLTPTLKAKRKVIETRYAADIEASYASPSLYRAA